MNPLFDNHSFMQHVGMHISHKKEPRDKLESPLSKEQCQELIDIKNDRKRVDKVSLPLYRNIGFALSFLVVIIVFNWRTPNTTLVDLGTLEVQAEEIFDIPISEQPPPPPPKSNEIINIVEVDNTVEIEELEVIIDVEATEASEVQEVVIDLDNNSTEEVVEEIFMIVEEAPEPIGGLENFLKYIADNIRYPRSAVRLGVTGKVFLKFVVEKDGSITDIQVLKGIGAGCDEEAVRVLSQAPRWKPGKQRGKPVRVFKTIPINFVLLDQ